MITLYSDNLDPFYNLALEEYLLRHTQDEYILLWRSRPAIIMGRFQNPFRECKVSKIQNDNIDLVRRISGGGCVYHDEGNLNFCFIGKTALENKYGNLNAILDLLKDFSIEGEINDRNDLIVNGSKVSGSAFKNIKERSFHHCTLLINSNLDHLQNYLYGKSIKGHGVESVKSPVLNLHQLNPELTPESFMDHIQASKAPTNIDYVDKRMQELAQWEWVYGECPRFELETPNHGTLICHKGLIQEGELKGKKLTRDDLGEFPEIIELLF